jgi:serine/threonine-protein kinase
MHESAGDSDEFEIFAALSPSIPPPATRTGGDPSVVAGSYRLLRELGRGTRGVVHEAESVWTGRRVALQQLHVVPSKEEITRFFSTARAAARLVHPHLVQVLDLGTDERGAPYAVLELLAGETLETHFSRRGPIPLGEALRLIEPIADALALAHEEGVVHGNLTPRAIRLVRMSEERVVPKVTGFGLWRWNADALIASRAEGLDALYYRAPAQRDGPPDPTSDLWALALCLYRALTGSVPYLSTDAEALHREMASRPLPPPSRATLNLPSSVDAVLHRALAIDRHARPPSMRALLADLVGLREEARPTLRPPPSAIETLDAEPIENDEGDDTELMKGTVASDRVPPRPMRLGLVWTAKDVDLDGVARAMHQVLARPIHVLRFTSYAELVDAVLEHDVELGWLPPVAYVRARRASGLRLLFTTRREEGTASYHAALLGRKGRVDRIDDARGKRAAWVDGWSAAGYLMPRALLARAGIAADADLAAQGFVGGHEAVIEALTSGTADVGGTYCQMKDGEIVGPFDGHREIVVLAVSEAIPGDTLCAGPAVTGPEAEAIGVLLREASSIIAPLIAARDLTPGDPAYYDALERALFG